MARPSRNAARRASVMKPSGLTIGLAANTTNSSPYVPACNITAPVSTTDRVCVDVAYANFLELLYTGSGVAFDTTIWRWKQITGRLIESTVVNTYVPYSVAFLHAEIGTIAAAHAESTYEVPGTGDYFVSTITEIYSDPAVKVTNPATPAAVASVLIDCQGSDIIEIAFDAGIATVANLMWSLL